MTGLASEGLNLLLPLGSQAPRGLFYRAASSIFEAFLPKRANQIGPTSTPVRQKGLTLTLAKQALRASEPDGRGLDTLRETLAHRTGALRFLFPRSPQPVEKLPCVVF